MLHFTLPLQQKSIQLHTSQIEALIRVMVLGKQYATGDVEYCERIARPPNDEINGQLAFEIKRKSLSSRLGLIFNIKVSVIFTEIKLGEGGPVFCSALLRQQAEVERIVADSGQISVLGKLGRDYEAAFRNEGFDGIIQSWDLLAAYARSYRMARLDPTRLVQMNTVFSESKALTLQFTDFSNIVDPKRDESRSFKFNTLIQDELENRSQIYEIRPDSNDDREFLLYATSGMALRSDKDNHHIHPRGKYNYAVVGGVIRIGAGIGHFWLSGSGRPVTSAGTVTFAKKERSGVLKSGIVTRWDNDSGHFRPHPGVVAVQGPFPTDIFESVHIREMVKHKRGQEALRLSQLRSPLDVAIDEAFKSRNPQGDSRDAITAIALKLDLSKTVVKNKMFNLDVIVSMKTSKWNESYVPK